MSTTKVEPHYNQVKGPVFLDIDFGADKVLGAGEFTTDRFEEFGVQEIGQVQHSHNIIDDNMVGFRVVEEGNAKRVEKLDQSKVAQLVKLIEDSGEKMSMPIKQSEIDLIERTTGYRLVIKDKSLVIDDVQER